MSKSFFIETYGCQMNVADSELVTGLLQQEGYTPTDDIDTADAIFVNTCAIREHAEEKVHSRLGTFQKIKQRRPDVIIGVLGCMAQNLKNDLLENKPYVDVILGPDSYRHLPDILQRNQQQDHVVDTRLSRFEVYDDLFPSRQEGINAWISIMRGCDKFCTFCIVPFTRGRERSRSVDSIVAEARQAVAEGFVEITLLGQNVNSYRHGNAAFPELLEAVAAVPGLRRLRYTSPHPQDVTEELIRVMAANPVVCNSIHFPLQSGSDRILKRMNRTYTRKHFLDLVQRMRDLIPEIGITTDIIVGFPGETEADFEDTLSVMETVKFDSAYTFKYSPRPYTKAADYTDQVPEEVKSRRLETLIAVQKRHTLEQNLKMVGKVVDVLVEKESKKSDRQWAGRTDNNKWVMFDKGTARIRDLVPVRITAATGVVLHGELQEG
ncbi:MAG: tRNA (N6-isopentenyl adenosine(37)-C2)-methylthiotransferase MiaB [Candidatus Neomarinimicrobiota bacterium]|nr:MAG: tRNA (N6-isopentenyl adenosine(37)-C2)-methylthiotransferase MiaB [Candidatus Neomarinimicrobiota bacterium]